VQAGAEREQRPNTSASRTRTQAAPERLDPRSYRWRSGPPTRKPNATRRELPWTRTCAPEIGAAPNQVEIVWVIIMVGLLSCDAAVVVRAHYRALMKECKAIPRIAPKHFSGGVPA
jgi:hypothetical protein